MHVYHFNHYEPTAFKKLMGRYATRGETRPAAARRTLRRPLSDRAAGRARRRRELLDQEARAVLRATRGDVELTDAARAAAGGGAGARRRSCRTRSPRRSGDAVAGLQRGRLPLHRGAARLAGVAALQMASHSGRRPSRGRQRRPRRRSPSCPSCSRQAEALRATPARRAARGGAASPDHIDHPRWLLAYLVDWHRREVNAEWWEFFRLMRLPDEDSRRARALAGLDVRRSGSATSSAQDRQADEVGDRPLHVSASGAGDRERAATCTRTTARRSARSSRTTAVARLIDVQKGPSRAELHPDALFQSTSSRTEASRSR